MGSGPAMIYCNLPFRNTANQDLISMVKLRSLSNRRLGYTYSGVVEFTKCYFPSTLERAVAIDGLPLQSDPERIFAMDTRSNIGEVKRAYPTHAVNLFFNVFCSGQSNLFQRHELPEEKVRYKTKKMRPSRSGFDAGRGKTPTTIRFKVFYFSGPVPSPNNRPRFSTTV